MAVMLSSGCSFADENVLVLLVGTYTGAGSEGMYVYQFDQDSGEFVSGEAVGFAEMENPSFLTVSDADIVYAVSEKPDSTAALSSFHFNPGTFEFQKLSTVSSEGEDPCYVSTDGKVVAVGNYSGGTMALFPVGTDGEALKASTVIKGAATGPDRDRQTTPHVHCSVFSPDGKYLIATDFSADRLMRYDLGTEDVDYYEMNPDTGPRHITFSPDGRFLYVIGELSGDVTVFEYGNELKIRQVIKAGKVDARGAADIHVSPDGRFLYASLRLRNDGIAIFSINEDGTLAEAGYMNTGIHPRNFNITPNGKFLLCACRDSDSVEVYSIDTTTGRLTKTSSEIHLSKPVCLVWHK